MNAKAKYGMGLVVDVTTGEILGWANYPLFNPNSVKKTSGEWKNRLAVDIFEPGSTMKPIMVAAALQEKVCTPLTEFYCENGKWQVAGRRIKDTHKYEKLSVNKIIRYSSNIGAAKIGLALGPPNTATIWKRSGSPARWACPCPENRPDCCGRPGNGRRSIWPTWPLARGWA